MKLAHVGLALVASLAAANASAAPPEKLSFGRFGEVSVVRPASDSPSPAQVVIFFAGDGGWHKGVVDMADALAEQGALVLGVETAHYLKALRGSRDPCDYPAGELEALSQFAQKKLGLPSYRVPILVGYSSGATLAYLALVQAPTNTFRGAISFGFCPDLELQRPFCKGHGLVSQPTRDGKGTEFAPSGELTLPWIAVHGEVDKVCSAPQTAAFAARVGHAESVMLPQVGHGVGVENRWRPALLDAFAKVTAAEPARPALAANVSDLPLVELPAQGTPRDVFAIGLSGDGGWASIDREVAGALADAGVAVVGFDSLQYFWTPRTPEQSADALARVVRHYLGAWQKSRVLLVGYSRGADVLPFMASRLPADLRERVALVALLGPALSVEFEFHVADWLGGSGSDRALAIPPEAAKLRGLKLLCIYGRDETESLCRGLDPALGTSVAVPGDHHFGGDYAALARRILDAVGSGNVPESGGTR
jgi:type IV secretory pathway VirJ component